MRLLGVELFNKDGVVYVFERHSFPADEAGTQHVGAGQGHNGGFEHRVEADTGAERDEQRHYGVGQGGPFVAEEGERGDECEGAR